MIVIDMTETGVPAYIKQQRERLSSELERAQRDQARATEDVETAEYRLELCDAVVDECERAIAAHAECWERRPEVKA